MGTKKITGRLSPAGPAPSGALEGVAAGERGAPRSAIVKVREPGYVPPGVTPRARLSPLLFTATLSAETLAQLERDPRVESIAPAEPLPPPRPPVSGR